MRLKYLKLRDGTYDLSKGFEDPWTREFRAPSYTIELIGNVVTITGEHEVLVLPFSDAAYGLADNAVLDSSRAARTKDAEAIAREHPEMMARAIVGSAQGTSKRGKR